MDVTAIETFVSADGGRRGRICWRPDGLLQVVTETLRPGDEEFEPHWLNDYPPSGIFNDRDEALAFLNATIQSLVPLEDVRQVKFDIGVGPIRSLRKVNPAHSAVH